MVKVRNDVVRGADGRIDVDAWVAGLTGRHPTLCGGDVVAVCRFVRGLGLRGEELLERGTELAELVSELRLDTASIVAAIAYRPGRARWKTCVRGAT